LWSLIDEEGGKKNRFVQVSFVAGRGKEWKRLKGDKNNCRLPAEERKAARQKGKRERGKPEKEK